MKKYNQIVALILAFFFAFSQCATYAYAEEVSLEVDDLEATASTEEGEIETTEEEKSEVVETEETDIDSQDETTEETSLETSEEDVLEAAEEDINEEEEDLLSEDDPTDTDNDGVTDYYEKQFGTNPEAADTDGDGLSDYEELYVITSAFVDATLYDTDNDGICDADEDSDEDGLSNKAELEIGTNPISYDTDQDGLSDGKELELGTSPLLVDTDGDGATDAWELENGFDPTVKQYAFTLTITSADGGATLEFTADGSVAENTKLVLSDTVLSEDTEVASYSKIYEVIAPEKGFALAKLTFNSVAGNIKSPLVYLFDSENETNAMTSAKTIVKNNRVYANIFSAGKYVLKSEKEVDASNEENTDAVEGSNTEVVEDKNPSVDSNVNTDASIVLDMCPEGAKDSNCDGISDEYTKLLADGSILSGDFAKVFGDKTFKEIQSCDDLDGDGLLNGQEITLLKSKDGVIYAVLSSSPVSLDTDGDGIYDADDTAPLSFGLKNGVVGNLRIVGKHDFSCIETEGHSFLVYTSYVDNYDLELDNLYSYYLLNEDKKDALAKNENLYSWRIISTSTTKESDPQRLASADSLYTLYEKAEKTTSIKLNRGESICIGNFTQKTYLDSVADAILNSEKVSNQVNVETLKILYSAFTGEDISIEYVLAHYAKIMADDLFKTYAFGEDVFDGATEGGIWINREMYDQAYQYDQFPNQIYEKDVTESQVCELRQFIADNSYYNIFSHNCSSFATGAWNTLFGYERDSDGNLIVKNGSYVKNQYNLSARTTGVWAIIDLPMVVSNNIKALGAVDPSGHVTKDGPLVIVNGCDVTNTVNANINHFTVKDETKKPASNSGSAATSSTASSSNAGVATDVSSTVKTAGAKSSAPKNNKTKSSKNNEAAAAEEATEDSENNKEEEKEESATLADEATPLAAEKKSNSWIAYIIAILACMIAAIAALIFKKKN